jgi:tetratricopeptide (TPR) repeat protein
MLTPAVQLLCHSDQGRKSQLAIQYCYDVREASPETWVFWVYAGTRARFEEAYRGIADRLELPGRKDPKTDTLKLVKDWLCDETNGQWIMVLDNADDNEVFYPKLKGRRGDSQDMPPGLATFLPQSQHGSILVTSRSKDAAVRLVGSDKSIKEVHAMDEGQAVRLLQNKLEDASNESGMSNLIRTLGHIPLAISQAAAYINHRAPRTTVSSYLDEFQKNDRKRTNLLNRDAGDLRRDEGASNSVVTTWQISFEQIREDRRSAADLLSLMSFFNPQGIPVSVLRRHSLDAAAGNNNTIEKNDSSESEDDSEFEDDIDMLRAYSLMTLTAGSDMCEMHPLVPHCTRVWLLSFNEVERWRRRFLWLMAREFPTGTYENRTKCQTLLPHIEPIFGHEPADEGLLEDWAQVLNNAVGYMITKGSYQEAESMAIKAVRTCERIQGQDGLDTLSTMNNLASALRYLGKYEAAEEMNRRVLEGREKVLGKEHPDTLTSVSNLALVLQCLWKYDAAEEMNRRALEGREKVLGKEHPDTLASVSNLAEVLRYQTKYEAAEKMNRRTLEGREKALGKEHPDTLDSVSNLALVLQSLGKYEAAEEMNRRALEGYEKALGKEHPDTLISMSNLASVLQDLGNYEAAEEMNRRALEGREKALGKEHPDTLDSVNNLALMLQTLGKYDAAEEMNR